MSEMPQRPYVHADGRIDLDGAPLEVLSLMILEASHALLNWGGGSKDHFVIIGPGIERPDESVRVILQRERGGEA
jgi:hypothetical protein